MHRNTTRSSKSLASAIVAGLAGMFGNIKAMGPELVAKPVASLPWDHNRFSRRRARFEPMKTRPTWVGAYERRYNSPSIRNLRTRRKAGEA